MQRWVGLGVIANNLKGLGRAGRASRDATCEGLDQMKGGRASERTSWDHAPHFAPLAPLRHHFCTGK
jgi:hypothetical protein